MNLKDETTGQEYELQAGVSIQVEKYSDFWRELPVIDPQGTHKGLHTD